MKYLVRLVSVEVYPGAGSLEDELNALAEKEGAIIVSVIKHSDPSYTGTSGHHRYTVILSKP